MKAAWDWHLPRETVEDEEALVSFAHELGFDTLIVHKPTQTMMDYAHQLGLQVFDIISPNVDDAFAQAHPDALQKMLPPENAIADAFDGVSWEPYTVQAHLWFPIVQRSRLLCFEHPAAIAELKRRIDESLTVADGIAFDGFGFLNHYACFCAGCQERRRQMIADRPELHEAAAVAEMSEESLVGISQILFAHTKSVKEEATVTNHLWPPFRPNPTYGYRLRLDYCSQTISWFYKPNWRLARVEFEAQEMKELEDPSINRFVPFIAQFEHPYLVRTAERIGQELEIAKRYGEGNLIFCNLKSLKLYPELGNAVQTALK